MARCNDGEDDDAAYRAARLLAETRCNVAPSQVMPIITTEANELMAPIHNRMPVIVPPD